MHEAKLIDDKPSQRAVARRPVSRFVFTPSLAVFSPSQIGLCLAITSNALTSGLATSTSLLPLPIVAVQVLPRLFSDLRDRSLVSLFSHPSDSELTYVDQPSTLQEHGKTI